MSQELSLGVKVADAFSAKFPNAMSGDVMYYASTPTQRIMFGTDLSKDSALMIGDGTVNIDALITKSNTSTIFTCSNAALSNLIVVSNATCSNVVLSNLMVSSTATCANMHATNATMGTGTFTNATIGTGTITNASIGTSTMTNATIGTGTITNAHIANAQLASITCQGATFTSIQTDTIDANIINATTVDLKNIYIDNYELTASNLTCSNVTCSNVSVRDVMTAPTLSSSNLSASNISSMTLTTPVITASNLSTSNVSTGGTLRVDANGNLTNVTISANSINAGVLGVSYGGVGAASLSANKVVVGNGTSAVLQPTNLHWDNANSRLGICNAAPTEALHVTGNILASSNITAFSDIRTKTELQVIGEAIDRVKQMTGYTFQRVGDTSGKRYAGVIAQEVQAVHPEVVMQHEDGMLSVAYGNMVGVLIEAIKELEARVSSLEKAR